LYLTGIEAVQLYSKNCYDFKD